MYLRKQQAGSGGGHIWDGDGDVLEVDDETALDLLAIPDGGFSEVAEPPKPETAPKTAKKTTARAAKTTSPGAEEVEKTPIAE